MIIFYFLILVMPLSQHHIWAKFVGDLTGIKYIGLACMPYALIHLAGRRWAPHFLQTWQARFLLLFYAVVTVSQISQGHLPLWFSHWLTYTSFLILLFVTVVVVDTVERARWVMLSAVSALGLASLYVLRDWQTFHNVYAGYRPGYVVGDPNYFTINVLLFMPLVLALIQTTQARWEKMYCLGCAFVALLALVVSASRGGFLGLVAACLFLIAKLPHRVRNFSLIGASVFILMFFTTLSPLERLVNPSQSDDDAAQIRKALWHGGLRMMEAHPIFGVGLDGFIQESTRYVDFNEVPQFERANRVAHNSYVEIGSEMGIPGLLAFVAILFCTFLSLGESHRQANELGLEFLARAALSLQAGIFGGSVAIFFVSGQYQKMLWLALFLSMCFPPLISETAERQELQERKFGHLDRISDPVVIGTPVATAQVSTFAGNVWVQR
jgi:O-antigen ligase